MLLRWFWQRIRNVQDRWLYRADSRGWQLTQALIRQFANQAKAAGTSVILLSIDERQPQLDGLLEGLAQELDAGFLDLSSMLRSFNASGYAYRLPGDGHWNAAGHHAIAEAVRDYLCGSEASREDCDPAAYVPSP